MGIMRRAAGVYQVYGFVAARVASAQIEGFENGRRL